MLIPIGAWCRTAYQVGEYLKNQGSDRISYPFDWTITSFKALNATLSDDFQADSILRDENARISRLGSVVDISTDIIFHHDLLPAFVKRFAREAVHEGAIPPPEVIASDEYAKGKSRFIHTYSNLMVSVRRTASLGETIGFVRWNRYGHPDKQMPSAFDGESVASLWTLLSRFAGTANVAVLQVVTIPIQVSELHDDARIVSYETSDHGARIVIRERPSFDGNGKSDFHGDTRSWYLALDRFVGDFAVAATSAPQSAERII